jgi:hypothetical protein
MTARNTFLEVTSEPFSITPVSYTTDMRVSILPKCSLVSIRYISWVTSIAT